MTWTVISYHPVTFFSLRSANATASGGKTLLVPTAFALKMAILNASIQTAGLEEGRQRFPAIRDLRIAVAPPDQIMVLKSFAKIRRQYESKFKASEADKAAEKIADLSEKGQYPFQSTIAYREFVQFGDPLQAPLDQLLRIACMSPDGSSPAWLGAVLRAINYLGKRGSFMQPVAQAETMAALEGDFIELTRDSTDFVMNGTLQLLDDCGSQLTFDQADIYSAKRIALGKERVLRHVVLPYSLSRSSRGFSLYERITVAGR